MYFVEFLLGVSIATATRHTLMYSKLSRCVNVTRCVTESTVSPTTFTTESQTTVSVPEVTTVTTASVSTASAATVPPVTTATVSTVTVPTVTAGTRLLRSDYLKKTAELV